MALSKYFRVYATQIKNNFVREAVYRNNFLTGASVDFIWILVEITLFTVIYSNTPTLAGWTKHQVYFFLGIFFSSDAFFTMLFQRNFWLFSDLVNKGELDILLTKPIHPLFLAMSRWMNLTALLNVIMGLAICIKYAPLAGFRGGWYWLLVPLWFLVGTLSQVLLRFMFVIWTFWTERGFSISRMYYQFFALATKPDSIYPKAIRYLIMTILPFAFISSVPARALLFGLSNFEYALLFGVLSLFAVMDLYLWNKGLQRYQSASS
ncbi:MAG: ABC transporter permease [Bacteriovoracia bacterium]